MTKRGFWKYLTRAHKWAGLILGIQILLWVASGFFMALFPIDDVRGSHLAKETSWSLSDMEIVPIELVMATYDGELTGASLTSIAGEPAYALIGDKELSSLMRKQERNGSQLTKIELSWPRSVIIKGRALSQKFQS